MAYNRANQVRRYIDIQRITQEHYVEGLTTYKGIWRHFIEPHYHITYQVYINILGMGGLQAELDAILEGRDTGRSIDPNQLSLLDMQGVSE